MNTNVLGALDTAGGKVPAKTPASNGAVDGPGYGGASGAAPDTPSGSVPGSAAGSASGATPGTSGGGACGRGCEPDKAQSGDASRAPRQFLQELLAQGMPPEGSPAWVRLQQLLRNAAGGDATALQELDPAKLLPLLLQLGDTGANGAAGARIAGSGLDGTHKDGTDKASDPLHGMLSDPARLISLIVLATANPAGASPSSGTGDAAHAGALRDAAHLLDRLHGIALENATTGAARDAAASSNAQTAGAPPAQAQGASLAPAFSHLLEVANGALAGVPVDHPDWGRALGDRLVWMARNDMQHARLELNPPELGPLEVNISVRADHASIVFAAHHVLTRDTLNQQMPRLRDLLAGNGFASVDVNVSDGGNGRSPFTGSQSSPRLAVLPVGLQIEPAADAGTGISTRALSLPRGLVDHYA